MSDDEWVDIRDTCQPTSVYATKEEFEEFGPEATKKAIEAKKAKKGNRVDSYTYTHGMGRAEDIL